MEQIIIPQVKEEKTEDIPAPLPLYPFEEPRQELLPPKTGTSQILIEPAPEFIEEVEAFEPIYTPPETIGQECLRRETERLAHQEQLLNRIVYDSEDPGPYSKKFELSPFYIPLSEDDTTLIFESRFESGNLRRVVQIYEFEYDLILRPDFFTKGHTQWYFFRVSNTRANRLYRFNIINMMKPDSLYNAGLRPLVYSVADATRYKRG